MGRTLYRVTKSGQVIGNWRDGLWELEQERADRIIAQQEQKRIEEYTQAIKINEAYLEKKKKFKRTTVVVNMKRESLYQSCGERIMELYEMKYTQKQIAWLLGISPQTVWVILDQCKKEGRLKE